MGAGQEDSRTVPSLSLLPSPKLEASTLQAYNEEEALAFNSTDGYYEQAWGEWVLCNQSTFSRDPGPKVNNDLASGRGDALKIVEFKNPA